jgi:hypothetical protein
VAVIAALRGDLSVAGFWVGAGIAAAGYFIAAARGR